MHLNFTAGLSQSNCEHQAGSEEFVFWRLGNVSDLFCKIDLNVIPV